VRSGQRVVDGEFLVASGIEGEVDELRLGKGISCAWSAGSIAFCDGGEARLEVEWAAGASGVDL
jgi:hypothetical protein